MAVVVAADVAIDYVTFTLQQQQQQQRRARELMQLDTKTTGACRVRQVLITAKRRAWPAGRHSVSYPLVEHSLCTRQDKTRVANNIVVSKYNTVLGGQQVCAHRKVVFADGNKKCKTRTTRSRSLWTSRNNAFAGILLCCCCCIR